MTLWDGKGVRGVSFAFMNELRLGETHDIAIEGGSFRRTASFRDCVRQRVLCMLRTELGEAFTDPGHGIPWFGEILGLPISHLDLATKILREKIAAIPGVAAVASLRLKVSGRNLSGEFKVECTGGDTAEGGF